MPIKVLNENSEEIEVFTKDELEAQRADAIEQFKKDNPGDAAALAKLQEDLKNKDIELEKLKGKDQNFANLREKTEKLEAEKKTILESMDSKIEASKKEVFESVMKDHYIDTLSRMSGDDKDLKDKIEFHFKRLPETASSKGEIDKKLQDAFVLATGGNASRGVSQTAFSSGAGTGMRVKPSSTVSLTEEEKEVARKLGAAGNIKITDEDLK